MFVKLIRTPPETLKTENVGTAEGSESSKISQHYLLNGLIEASGSSSAVGRPAGFRNSESSSIIASMLCLQE